jgi:hypothetical protein
MCLQLDENGRLPEGRHAASLSMLQDAFCWNQQRTALFAGLREALRNLKQAGVRFVCLGGSFLTDKDVPDDIDGCWRIDGNVDVDALDPVFLQLDNPRLMWESYGVDFFRDTVGWQVQHLGTTRDGGPVGVVIVALDEETFDE